jgi:hypothetical protein
MTRVVGFFVDVGNMNHGKMEEYFDRKVYNVKKSFDKKDRTLETVEAYR